MQLKCRPPSREPGNATIAVSGNGVDFVYAETVYEYLAVPVVTEVKPTYALTQGGSVVTISGAGFSGSAPLHCQFGLDSPSTFAEVLSTSHVTCVVPAHSTGLIDFSVVFLGLFSFIRAFSLAWGSFWGGHAHLFFRMWMEFR